MLNCIISSDLTILEELHIMTKWTPSPNKNQLKHSKIVEERKNKFYKKIKKNYETMEDYIYDIVFNSNLTMSKNNKIKTILPIPNKKKLLFNSYPYNVPKNTKHSIMWYTYIPESNDKITQDIDEQLYDLFDSKIYNFIWFSNPNKTIKHLFYVHVFWIIK